MMRGKVVMVTGANGGMGRVVGTENLNGLLHPVGLVDVVHCPV